VGDLVRAEYYMNEASIRQPNGPAKQMLERIRAIKNAGQPGGPR
jgi:hypothetical protein